MIEIRSLTKVYKNGFKALDGIDLTLPDKGLICITGESGSGKTTLLNCIRGNISYEGSVTLYGINSSGKDVVSMVYQDFRLLEDQTVETNLRLAKEAAGKKLSGEELLSVLKKVGLDEKFIKRKCKNLSGGEKQRVAIARTLVQESSVILADEPTGSLDGRNSKAIFELFKELSSDYLIIVVTHSKRYASEYRDYAIVMDGGKIVSCDLPQYDAARDHQEEKRQSKNTYRMHNAFSHQSVFDMIKIPYKNKAVTAVLTAFLVVFSVIACLLGSASKISTESLLEHNAKTKRECIIQIYDKAVTLSQRAKDLPYLGGVYFGFKNNDFVNGNVGSTGEICPDANYLMFQDSFAEATFIECDQVSAVGGKLIAGRDVREFNELIINESLAYRLLCKGEYAGKKLNDYNDLIDVDFGGFVVVGVLGAYYDMYQGEYKNLTVKEYMQLSDEERVQAAVDKSVLDTNGIKTYVVKEGYSVYSKGSSSSLNPHVKNMNVNAQIEKNSEIYDSINFSSKSQITGIIGTFEDNYVGYQPENRNDYLVISSPFSIGMENIGYFMDSFGDVIVGFFTCFVAGTLIFCFSLVCILLRRSNNQFSVLCDLGLTKKNMMRIRTASMLIIGVFVTAIACFSYVVAVLCVNILMRNTQNVLFELLSFDAVIFVCVSALLLISIALGSVIFIKGSKSS